MLRRAAACFRFQRVELRAVRIAEISACCLAFVTWSRMGESLLSLGAGEGLSVTGAEINGLRDTRSRNSLAITSAFRRMVSLRMQFSSSRTLPGHWYAVRASLRSRVSV